MAWALTFLLITFPILSCYTFYPFFSFLSLEYLHCDLPFLVSKLNFNSYGFGQTKIITEINLLILVSILALLSHLQLLKYSSEIISKLNNPAKKALRQGILEPQIF